MVPHFAITRLPPFVCTSYSLLICETWTNPSRSLAGILPVHQEV